MRGIGIIMKNNKVINSQPLTLNESSAPWDSQIDENFQIKVFLDKYPVTDGHRLYVPKYNDSGMLLAAFEEAIHAGLEKVNTGEWDGFNIGLNVGEAAGQTVGWPHVHLIPRRKGDMEDPTGGVRHVIPEKGNYRKW